MGEAKSLPSSVDPLEYVLNLHGQAVHLADVVAALERAWPDAPGKITHTDRLLPIPTAMDDAAHRAAIGKFPATPLAQGVRAAIKRFAER